MSTHALETVRRIVDKRTFTCTPKRRYVDRFCTYWIVYCSVGNRHLGMVREERDGLYTAIDRFGCGHGLHAQFDDALRAIGATFKFVEK